MDGPISEREAMYCIGMSKMTVIKETANNAMKYEITDYPELLEMIGRVAEIKYKQFD